MPNGPSRPAYASSCRNWAAFDSACACFGVRQSTVTASAVRITRTATITTTIQSSTASSPAGSQQAFALEIHALSNQRSSSDPYLGVDQSTNSILYLGPKPHNASADALAFSLGNSTSGPWSIRSKFPGSFAGADFTASNRSFVAIGNTEFYPNTQLQCKIDGNKAFTCQYKNGLVGNWFLCSRQESGNTKYDLVISILTDPRSAGCAAGNAVGLTAVAVPAGS